MAGQAGIEPTVSIVITRMGDHTLLSHMAAGSPAGGLCLLSAEIRIERKKRQWLIAVEGGAGIEPAISHVLRVCLPKAPTAHFEGGAGLPRYAPAPGIVRTSAAGRTRTPLCHGIRCLIPADPVPTPSGRGIFTRAVCPAVKRHCLPLCHRVLTLRRVPVSPGCQAAASVFALTPMTSGCPASVFPSGFAVSQGLAPCGPTSGHGSAPCGRWRYSLCKASLFFKSIQVKNSRAHPR